jgi:hypothetical protein
MAEVIGLRIQLNGINTVINDVDRLEKLLKEAKADLVDIGINFGTNSENFKKLANEINKVEKELGKIKSPIEQNRKELEVFNRSVNALSQGFAGAITALTLFGNESENVTNAQKVASQSLSVVIAAQTIAQIELGASTVASTIATRAQTIAVNTSNTAMKALFTTIAANPVGALVAVIGLAVAAFAAFNSEVEQSEDLTKTFTKTYNTELQKLSVATRINVGIVNDLSKSVELRTEKLEELTKAFPEQFKGLNKEKVLNGEVKLSYDQLRVAIEKTAKSKAVLAQLDVTSQRLVQVDEDIRNKQRELTQIERQLAEQQSGSLLDRINIFNQFGQLIKTFDVGKAAGQVAKLKEEIGTLNKEQKNLTNSQERLIKQATNLAQATGNNTTNTNGLTDAQKALIDEYEERLERQNELIDELKTLNDLEVEFVDNQIKNAEKVRDELNRLLKARSDFFTTEADKFKEEINDIFFEAFSPEEFNKLKSSYLQSFDLLFDGVKSGVIKLVNEQGEAISFNFENIKKIIQSSNLPEEVKKNIDNLTVTQQEALAQFFTSLSKTAEQYSKEIKIGDKIITPLDKETAQKNLTELLVGVQDILKDQDLGPGEEAGAIKKLIESIFEFPTKTAEDFKNELDKTGETGLALYNEGIEILKNNLLEFATANTEVVSGFEGLRTELNAVLTEIAGINSELEKTTQITDEKLNVVIDKLAQKIGSNTDLLGVFLQDVADNTEKYVETFTQEGLLKVINGLTNGLEDIKGKSKEELTELLGILLAAQRTIENEFGEGTATAFDELIKRVKIALNELPTDTDDKFKKTLDNISKGIQQLQQILGSLGQTFADSFALELERLEFNYNDALDGVVGDTKEANEKRIELEKGYQKEKRQIEKQARLVSLRIQLAETIAAGAQGVVTALAILPPAGPILAGINAAIAAAQIALVAQQISFVSQLRRGGRLAAGGTVMGPSHENGGVRYMNGGVELEGNEAVVNRNSTIKYGSLLSSINQAEGGRPILVGNAMDSRLIEVLAKQKQEPIRAYVLESDITKSQTINRKLEQLASF